MRILIVPGVLATLAASVAWAQPVPVCVGPEASVTSFGEKPRDILEHNDPQNPVRYLRLRITRAGSDGSGWQLMLRDNDYRPLQAIGPAELAPGASLWSDRLATTTVKLDLALFDGASAPQLSVSEYIAMPEEAREAYTFYSVQGSQPRWSDLFASGSEAWRRAGDAVGMLVGGRQHQTWCCSGVVVQREPIPLFLTNFHCGAPDPGLADRAFWSQDVCDSTVVDFSWDGDRRAREYACRRVVATAADLDLALLELAPLARESGPPPPAAYLGTRANVSEIVVVHHPKCLPKQISRNCRIEQKEIPGWRSRSGMTDFSHRCDTEGGSSGAPVFDPQGRLVGIHHLGFEKVDGECDRLNKAIWLDAARDLLQAHGIEAGGGGGS
jgi:hypothetical protein